MCYKKRSQFISSKKKLKGNVKFSNAFVAEDLTSLRAKLLRYVKDECNNQFEQIHAQNDSILMKTSAETDESQSNERKSKWIKVDSPDHLYRYNIDIDFKNLDYMPLHQINKNFRCISSLILSFLSLKSGFSQSMHSLLTILLSEMRV